MCRYAGFPDPKTVTSCTECLFLNNIVLARAVRKAVISAVFNSARGFPERSKRVRLPFAVVGFAWEETAVVELTWESESASREEDRDSVSEDVGVFLSFKRVVILTPRPSLLLAGTTSIFAPSLLFSLVPLG